MAPTNAERTPHARRAAGWTTWGGGLIGLLLAVVAARAGEAPAGLEARAFAARSVPAGATMFTEMPAAETGVATENRYVDPRMWAARYQEFEVGAIDSGVAIGDYDNDGRPDIFTVSKTDTCRLFRNLGNWKFADVTTQAGVGDAGDAALVWKQGAAFADVNNDGFLDLYVCRFDAPNLLYINQRDGTFKEEASARGLALVDSSVMGAFCDYDRDGALDVFVLTNILDSSVAPDGQRDHLFHNRGDGTFVEVTDRAGLSGPGQGHSATWWDYDEDGWPDLYVANDFYPADQLWRNQRDGTFRNVIDEVVPHMPYSAMGSDLGDVNNDGHLDLFVTEMAATTHQKDQRAMAASRALLSEEPPEGSTAASQYFRNALYVNTGTGRCVEAAILAGVAATDWTWSPRFEDLDNDGRVDLHVTNGMHRESHNTDLRARMMLAESRAAKIRIEKASPVLSEANLAFRNLGDLQFQEVGAAWGLNQRGVSFGSALGDLDGDGDLDLVYANFEKGVTVLRNDSPDGHRVVFALRGTHSNRFGVGATIRIETASGVQVRQLVVARGVVSSSEPILHFGLGADAELQRVEVRWPDGQSQVFTQLPADQRYTVTEPVAAPVGALRPASVEREPGTAQFEEVSSAVNLAWVARESRIDETGTNPLLPMRQNRRGPALAVGDLQGDGRDDLVLGGTPAEPARLLFASDDGRYTAAPAPRVSDTLLNDGPIAIFDADGDGDQDVLITRAGVARPAGSAEYQPALLLNDGAGRLTVSRAALPALPWSVGAVAVADFDRDGRLDLLIASRVLPGQYPFAPRSALLVNRGGTFADVTDAVAPGLREAGMVTSALWSDVDDDDWLDLLIALEWGPVKCFHNEKGKIFSDWTERAGFASAGSGWWNSLAAADFNGDGQLDYAAGNLGLNTPYHAEVTRPALLYAGDFNGDGAIQLIEAYHEGDHVYPRRTRKDLAAAIPGVMKRFPRNDSYARATLGEIVGEERLAAAQRFAATEFRSGVFLSQPDHAHRFVAAPRMAQVSPWQGLAAGDFDGDGFADLYAVQNSYAPVPFVGRFDSGLGAWMRGDGRGDFSPVPSRESGLSVPGDAKALVVVDLGEDGWPDFVVTRNDRPSLAWRNRGVAGRHSLAIRLHGPAGNPTAIGARISVEMSDGSRQSAEIAAGSGYYSQSTAACFFGWTSERTPRRVHVRWPLGATSDHPIPAGTRQLTLTAP